MATNSELHLHRTSAHVAQLVEHVLGKNGVTGSSPVVGSRRRDEQRKPVRNLADRADSLYRYRRVIIGRSAFGREQRSTVATRNNRRNPINGQAKICAHEAAPQRRYDRPHRPRQDQPHRGDHQGPRPQAAGRVPRLLQHRQGAGRAPARHHHRHRARGVRDGEPPLRPHRLPRSRRLHQEHDHRRRPDGRRHPRRRRQRRPDAPDPRARPPGPPGGSAGHGRLPEQGGHDGRPGAARPGRARSPRAAQQVRVPRRRHPDHPRQRPQGAGEHLRRTRTRRSTSRSGS